MPPLKRQTAGQPFDPSAGTWNQFVDVTENVLGQGDKPGAIKSPNPRQPSVVWIKNNSGANRGRFDVLALSDPLITPEQNENEFLNRPAFNAVALTGDDNETIVVLQEPLTNGQLGMAVVLGVTAANIEIAGADHGYADYSSSHPEYLVSAVSGPIKILYNPGVSGEFAYVLLGGAGGSGVIERYVLLESLPQNGTALAVKLELGPSGWTTTTQMDVIYDAYIVAGIEAIGQQLMVEIDESGRKIAISHVCDRYEM